MTMKTKTNSGKIQNFKRKRGIKSVESVESVEAI